MIGKDILILAFYIVVTIVLILVGKFFGMKLFEGYHKLDPGSYRSSCDYGRYSFPKIAPDGSTLPEQTAEEHEAEVEACAIKEAQDAGRSIGGVMGGVLGFLLVAGKTYQLYKTYTVE